MRLYLSAFFAAVLMAAACNNTPKETPATGTPSTATAAPATPATPSSELGAQGTNDLMAMIMAYYELKDALVATDPGKADAAASRVLSAAETMHHSHRMPKDEDNTVFQTYVDSVMSQSEAIVNVKDETCEKKRASFEHVSDALYGMAKTVHLKNGGVYRQFCPMAFNDKGAYWLSHESEIKNPYFGRKMLECGEVRDSL